MDTKQDGVVHSILTQAELNAPAGDGPEGVTSLLTATRVRARRSGKARGSESHTDANVSSREVRGGKKKHPAMQTKEMQVRSRLSDTV